MLAGSDGLGDEVDQLVEVGREGGLLAGPALLAPLGSSRNTQPRSGLARGRPEEDRRQPTGIGRWIEAQEPGLTWKPLKSAWPTVPGAWEVMNMPTSSLLVVPGTVALPTLVQELSLVE